MRVCVVCVHVCVGIVYVHACACTWMHVCVHA